MAGTSIYITFVVITLACCCLAEPRTSTYYFTKYLDQYCLMSKTQLEGKWGVYGIMKYSQDKNLFTGSIQCTIKLDTFSDSQVVYLDVEKYNLDCDGKGYIRFYDGASSTDNVLNELKAGMYSYKSIKIRSSGRNLTIVHNLTDLHFCSKPNMYHIRYTTQNKDGYCVKPGQIVCDNGYCINNLQKCDGYDNCGDGSDESRSLCDDDYDTDGISFAGWIGISTASILFGSGIMLAAIFYHRRRNASLSNPTVIQQGEHISAITVPQVITNAGYTSGPHQHSQPSAISSDQLQPHKS